MGVVSSLYGKYVKPINKLAAKGVNKDSDPWDDEDGEIERIVEVEMVGNKEREVPTRNVKNVPFEIRKAGVDGIGGFCKSCSKAKVWPQLYCWSCGMRFEGGLDEDVLCERLHEGAFLDSEGNCGVCHYSLSEKMNFCPSCGTMVVRKDRDSGQIVKVGMEVAGLDFDAETIDVSKFVDPIS